MRMKIILGISAVLCAGLAQGADPGLLPGYESAGAGPFSPDAGRRAWTAEHPAPDGGVARSCASCHGTDGRQPGRHAETGKPIDPMAVSVNPARLSDPAKVEKWFRRNCRWTLGRECAPQEKGDFVQYLSHQ